MAVLCVNEALLINAVIMQSNCSEQVKGAVTVLPRSRYRHLSVSSLNSGAAQ